MVLLAGINCLPNVENQSKRCKKDHPFSSGMSKVRLVRIPCKMFKFLFSCSFQEIDGFDVGTKDTGDFLVHCHRDRPTVILGNTEGIGRLKLVSACHLMDLD